MSTITSLRNHGVLLAGTVVLLVAAGCSSASVANDDTPTGVKGQGGQGAGGNGGCGVFCAGFGGGAGGAIAHLGNIKNCGNSVKDQGEGCDDGNTTNGDGCNSLCQVEADWACPTVGQPCQYLGVCGNSVLTSNKECEDGNTKSGDGCSSTCKLEPGWSCRVAGKPCTPTCGDGKVELGKQCDDGNDVSGDGCSSTCQIEPGASCIGSPSVCTKGVCGNGIVETGETCDCGTDPTKLPTGCTGPNGLFNGDGTGCSKTCTVEPICRGTSGTGTTHACTATCGNGNLETGEECDDGNLIDSDGCSKACKIEGGFTCSTQTNPDTQPCTQTIYSGECLELPVK
jgi:cysteine-rich repeat protein